MTLAEWRDLAETASNAATVLAVVVGGIWTYLLFVRNREKYPQGSVSQHVEFFTLTPQIRVVRVAIKIENTGKVLLPLRELECRLLQVSPVAGSLVTKITNPASLVESGRHRIQWPMIDDRKWNFRAGEAELEPGESETLRCDFVLQPTVNVIQVYSHVRNPSKNLIGWTCLSHVDFDKVEVLNAQGT